MSVCNSLVAQKTRSRSTKEDGLDTYYRDIPVQKFFRRSKPSKKIEPQKPLKTFVPFRDISYNYVPSSHIIHVTVYEFSLTMNRSTYNNLSSYMRSVINKDTVLFNIYPLTKAYAVILKEIHERKVFSASLKEDVKTATSNDRHTKTKPADTANRVEVSQSVSHLNVPCGTLNS